MNDAYKRLGFKQPDFIENPYGIRIYIGTEGYDDWCVEIPKELCKMRFNGYTFDKNHVFYFVTEDRALELAAKWTELAKLAKRR